MILETLKISATPATMMMTKWRTSMARITASVGAAEAQALTLQAEMSEKKAKILVEVVQMAQERR